MSDPVSVRVAVLDDYQQVAADLADWSGRLPSAELRFFHSHHASAAALVADLESYDVVVAMRERTPFPRDVLTKLPRLRLLVTTGMHNASIDLGAAAQLGVAVTGTGGVPGATAELTWALVLGLTRTVAADDARVRAGGWQDSLGRDLAGHTLGVVGLGRLGSRVAQVGRAFGMRVVAWSPHLTAERAAAQEVEAVSKADLFASSDVVTIHMPLHESTRGLIGEADLRAMRGDAVLVNTSRGPLIDEKALARALEEGWFRGAGLDVFDIEPLPAEHWLRRAPRTLLSPHMGYVTEATYKVFYQDAVEDIAAFLAGSPVRLLTPAPAPATVPAPENA
ncbi:MAG TPA: D-2-hydroxyacid dehydrogenase family protein [Actinocrinis sp.]